jgi:hypothetical protein
MKRDNSEEHATKVYLMANPAGIFRSRKVSILCGAESWRTASGGIAYRGVQRAGSTRWKTPSPSRRCPSEGGADAGGEEPCTRPHALHPHDQRQYERRREAEEGRRTSRKHQEKMACR